MGEDSDPNCVHDPGYPSQHTQQNVDQQILCAAIAASLQAKRSMGRGRVGVRQVGAALDEARPRGRVGVQAKR